MRRAGSLESGCLFALVLGSIKGFLRAEAVVREWTRFMRSNNQDVAFSVGAAADGSIYFAGLRTVILMGKSIVVMVMPFSRNTVVMVPKYGLNYLEYLLSMLRFQLVLVAMVRSTSQV